MRPTAKTHRVLLTAVPHRDVLKPSRLLIGLAVLCHSATSLAVNFERGRLLYENQCQACHTRMLHTPEARKVKNLTDLQVLVGAWAIHAGEDWGPEEVNDVTLYLDRSYYHFGEYIR